MKRLIKSDKLCKLLKLWCEYNELPSDFTINIRRGDWDHGGVCLIDQVVQFHEYISRMEFSVILLDKEPNLKDGEDHKISELIGEV